MSEGLFTAHGDEAIEARIVAWVLGEASAFEAAELERLCDERPELMVFKRRIAALHGMLAEAENAKPDEAWKLPPEKRKAVEAILGEEKPVRLEVVKEKRIRHSGRRAFLAIAACLALAFVTMYFQPWKKTSEAIIEVRPVSRGMSPLGGEMAESSGAGGISPQFFATEFEKIKSRNTLEKVVEKLDLAERWDMDKDQAVEKLKDSIDTKNVRGTDLVKIQVRQSDKKDADDIAREIAFAYKDYRQELEQRDAERQLAELNKAVRDQEDKVEERRKVLSTIVRNKGIIYRDSDSIPEDDRLMALRNESREEAIKRGLDAQDYVDAKREFETDQKLLQEMKLKQMGETISRKIPSDSVVIHELPGDDSSPGSRSTALASNESSPARSQRLRTDLPAELIEGTPQRMNVPNLEVPSNGPAGVETWSLASRGSSVERKSASQAEVARRPSPPESSISKVIAANTVSPTAIPVPDAEVNEPSLAFGGADLGASWGGGTVGGGFAGDSQLAASDSSADSAPGSYMLDRYSRADAPTDGSADGNGTLAGRVGGTALPVTPATPAELGLIDSADPVRSNPAKADAFLSERSAQATEELGDDFWDTSKLAAEGIALDKKREIHAGYGNEYRFSGADLFEEGKALPDDPEALAKAIREQEDKVEERRKVLATIVRTKGINYKGQDSFYSQEGVDEDLGARSALQAYHELERDKIQLETQINSLLKYDSEQLMVYAAGLDLPDNNVRQLYPKYLEAKRLLQGETLKGLGDEHPSVKAKVEQMEALKRQLDESVINLRQTMRAQLEFANKRLKEAEAMKDQPRELAIKRGLDAQDYVDAKREFERDQELLQQMKLKLMRAKAEAPKPDISKLMEEISAAEEPFSTFSLNISDASFRIAQAALAKGEQPDPAGIKVEQFYNAVDYGDPAPASNEPVACAIEQAAHPVIPGRNLVRIALKTAAAGRSAAQPLRLTLMVDQSGSMTRADRRAAMDQALAGLAGLLTKDDVVNVIGFSRTPRLLADGMTGDQAGKLADLVNQSASEGGTNLEEAMKLSEQLALRHQQPGAQNRIVLFTDGAANLGDADPERLAEKVKDLRQKGIAFDIAGIAADDLNDALLGELARNGNGRYYVVGKDDDDNFAKQLAGAFRPAAENVKVQVRFNPERVARYKLIGFEKDRLKTEDFRNDKVDAAELAAEEAGVAIYQVEPLPEGRGEIGEVSVRFRDTAAGEMVERAWTIPHDAAAPALDRATPSMQLATLAMLAAEKLKGGPLGEAVDFRQFAAAQAEVKAYYSGNPRVAELLRMLEMLK